MFMIMPGQDMWWSRTENMEKDAVTLQFRIIRDDYSKILCYGVSFYKKRCLVRLKVFLQK